MRKQAKKLYDKFAKLKNEVVNYICEECKNANIGAVSFNMNCIDKVYCTINGLDGSYPSIRVTGFQVTDNTITLMTEDDYMNLEENEDEGCDEIVNYTILTPEHSSELDRFFPTSLDEILDPCDCLQELLVAFEEVIDAFHSNDFEVAKKSITWGEIFQ